MNMAVLPLLILLGVLVALAAAVILVAASRRRTSGTGPRCGNCGYNLTGAPSNRCPECGQLFIEAGVITEPPRPLRSRRLTRVLVLLFVVFTGLAVLGTARATMQARAARARAVAARQAAVQAQLQARAAQQTATSAPASRRAEQPPQDP